MADLRRRKPIPADLITRYRRGELNASAVAQLAGVCVRTALARLREAGVEAGYARDRRLRASVARDVSRLYAQGLTLRAVAARVGYSYEYVRRLLTGAGVRRRPTGPSRARRA